MIPHETDDDTKYKIIKYCLVEINCSCCDGCKHAHADVVQAQSEPRCPRKIMIVINDC